MGKLNIFVAGVLTVLMIEAIEEGLVFWTLADIAFIAGNLYVGLKECDK